MKAKKQLEQQSSNTARASLWFCLGMRCAPQAWLVQRDLTHSDLWTIAENSSSTPYRIAADVPICPHCGENLHEAALEEKSYLP